MAVVSRNNGWSLVLRFEGKQKWLSTNCRTKTEAQRIQRECLSALDANNFSFIREDSRHILIKLHRRMGWTIPADLIETPEENCKLTEEANGLTLWNQDYPQNGAVQIFFSDPIILQKRESTLQRYSQCFSHLIGLLRANTPVKNIWVGDLRRYYANRINQGASPNTIGWEISTLSAMFEVLKTDRKSGITENPCQLLRGKRNNLSFAAKQRQSYLSLKTINTILSSRNPKTQRSVIPQWLKPVILCGYFTGMRLNEILTLKRRQLFLDKRMIFLSDLDNIKEGKPKRIPVHKKLHPILEECLNGNSSLVENIFLLKDSKGNRPIKKDSLESAFRRLVRVLRPEPRFSFHDLRHTFRSNGSRSGISDRILERILGHSDNNGCLDSHLSVQHRYGAISDQELVDAIDQLTFDHGDSEINSTPLILNPVSFLLAKTKKQDIREIEYPANYSE